MMLGESKLASLVLCLRFLREGINLVSPDFVEVSHVTRSGLFLDGSGGKERQPGFGVGVCKQIWRHQEHIENTT